MKQEQTLPGSSIIVDMNRTRSDNNETLRIILDHDGISWKRLLDFGERVPKWSVKVSLAQPVPSLSS